MTFSFDISSALATGLITLVSTIISSVLAKRTAEATANKEIETLKVELSHRDKVRAEEAKEKLDHEFSRMIASINSYIFSPDLDSQSAAATSVTVFMRHNMEPMTSVLSKILSAIDYTDADTPCLQKALRPLMNELTSTWCCQDPV